MKKTRRKRKPSKSEAFEKALASCSSSDFDGHSDFDKLTPEQRLDWLSELADFVIQYKGAAAKSKS